MSRLGIEIETGLVYEGRDAPIFPVWPTPVVLPATLIAKPSDVQNIPQSFTRSPFGWVFVETFYDFGARIRRGKLFRNYGGIGREVVNVEAHPATHSDKIIAANNSWRVPKSMTVFSECLELLQMPNKGEGIQLMLGLSDAASGWKIIQVERTIEEDVLLTLRSESAMRILPELDHRKISTSSLASVKSAYDRALNAAYRELPTSVVDQCRNASVVFISRWFQEITDSHSATEKDLGAWIKTIKNEFGESEKIALRSALEIINKLHPRGKDNERLKMSLRKVDESDAEFAIHALAFVLREIKWVH